MIHEAQRARSLSGTSAVAIAMVALLVACGPPRGLITHQPGVAAGYVLFGPSASGNAFLIDNEGHVVNHWRSNYSGDGGYLLPNGHLLRAGRDPDALHFRSGGVGGVLQEFDWDGELLWEWKLSDELRILHHDIQPLPNGNILAIAWEKKTRAEALAMGRRADLIPDKGLYVDWVLEIEPQPPDGARIVWEWHVWDHLVQDVDPKAPAYSNPAKHPGRLDLNALAPTPDVSDAELAQLKALGYVPEGAEPADLAADFLHVNSIDYHPELDQLLLSVPELGELWIVDHSTTTEEARGRSGGRSNLGGDLIYRWGNPAAYGRGANEAPRLFHQHDARWVRPSLPGAGHITFFNNGRGRPAGEWSSVEEIAPPLQPDRRYALPRGGIFGPAQVEWSWRLPAEHYSAFISGAQRVANGNTLVCSGLQGVLLEVDRAGEIVWDYRNPFAGSLRLADGSPTQPGADKIPYAVFRATRIAPDHPGLAGRTLRPLDPQPALRDN